MPHGGPGSDSFELEKKRGGQKGRDKLERYNLFLSFCSSSFSGQVDASCAICGGMALFSRLGRGEKTQTKQNKTKSKQCRQSVVRRGCSSSKGAKARAVASKGKNNTKGGPKQKQMAYVEVIRHLARLCFILLCVVLLFFDFFRRPPSRSLPCRLHTAGVRSWPHRDPTSCDQVQSMSMPLRLLPPVGLVFLDSLTPFFLYFTPPAATTTSVSFFISLALCLTILVQTVNALPKYFLPLLPPPRQPVAIARVASTTAVVPSSAEVRSQHARHGYWADSFGFGSFWCLCSWDVHAVVSEPNAALPRVNLC